MFRGQSVRLFKSGGKWDNLITMPMFFLLMAHISICNGVDFLVWSSGGWGGATVTRSRPGRWQGSYRRGRRVNFVHKVARRACWVA